jgi:hypothetical protein
MTCGRFATIQSPSSFLLWLGCYNAVGVQMKANVASDAERSVGELFLLVAKPLNFPSVALVL